jgi:DNA-binding MarR family transcriptional regulator
MARRTDKTPATGAATNPAGPDPLGAGRIAEQCLAVRIRMLNRTISNIYDEALRPAGITVGQLNILVVIAERGSVAPGAVASLLNMEKSTVSRNVERMRRQGWLRVSPGESGRGQSIALERSGRSLLKKVTPAWEQAQGRAAELLGPRGQGAIHQAAERVWARLSKN